MKKQFLHTIIGLALLSWGACQTPINVVDFQPTPEQRIKLPKLMPSMEVFPTPVSQESMAFWGQLDSAQRQPILLPPVLDSSELRGIRTSYAQNSNANTLQVYFTRDVIRNLVRQDGPAKGYITCQLSANETGQNANTGMACLVASTFGLALLAGAPTAISNSSLEIEVVIKNLQNQPIKTYWGIGNAKMTSTIYTGYHPADLNRMAQLTAFKKALASVKSQIDTDHSWLEQQLK